jgi:hypothetical protein
MSAPRTIGDLLARDLSKGRIEEIIKVDQVDEQSVYTELTEYVVTDRLRDHCRRLLKAIAEYPSDPHEGVGVWVSGFFGSGKSSFAKNLGYVIGNRQVLGHRAAELFKKQVDDATCAALIDSVNARFPTEVVMFDVQTDRASGGSGSVSLSHYMYRSLLRTLDYAEDFDIADLEQSLEVDGRLEEFVSRFEVRFGDAWRKRRKMARKMNEASAVLHEMEPRTYPQADSWAVSQAGKRVEITPNYLVEKTFELAARRRPGKAVMFVIDEVGAYVARSAERIEDLRAVVEQFGKTSKNLVKARKALGPVWVIVTAQEKLDEVVAAIDSKRVELAKLQDRFPYRVDLAPADIREVATKRVLGKTAEGRKALEARYKNVEGQLNQNLHLDWPAGRTTVDRDEFVEFYPYPPHFVDLSIDIMSGIRLQPGAPRHLGGSNRTIIKQAYEMLVSERTGLARAEIGRLVTLDLVFELVEGNLSTEKQKDLSDITSQFDHGSWEVRTAKAVALLEFVRTLSRTDENIAAVLVDNVPSPAPPLPQVRVALDRLRAAKFVRHTEDGWKLQTESEKSWDIRRRAIDPRPRDRHETIREALEELFSDPSLKTFSYRGLRSFRVGLTVDDVKVEDGQIPVRLVSADSADAFRDVQRDSQARSRQSEHQNNLFWVFALTPEIDAVVGEVVRSRQMVTQYELLRGQGKITPEEAACLANEKNEAMRFQGRLREQLSQALVGGTGFFRGVSKDGSSLGKGLHEVFRRWFEACVPDLYPKLEMGARSVDGGEAEALLKAVNLAGLQRVFYDPPEGLSLVKKEGARYVVNTGAPVADEVLHFIEDRTRYGERVTGRDLEARFCGLGYGWERELVQLAAAALFRGGALEVTYQGRRYRDYQDALARAPFTNATAFRGAVFSPRESVGLKVLTTAAQRYEELTGQEVDIEEGAIASAFKRLVAQERELLVPALARARAHRLPVEGILAEFDSTLQGFATSPTDDCVRSLAEQGRALKEAFGRVRKIRDAMSDDKLGVVQRARLVLEQEWPQLRLRGIDAALGEAAERLRALVEQPEFVDALPELSALADQLGAEYSRLYDHLHQQRSDAVQREIDAIKSRPEWVGIGKEEQEMLAAQLVPLTSRLCEGLLRADDQATCRHCRATLGQLDSDIAAAAGLAQGIVRRIEQAVQPKQRIERVRLRDLAVEPIESEEAIDRLLETLRAQLTKLVAEGVRIIVE